MRTQTTKLKRQKNIKKPRDHSVRTEGHLGTDMRANVQLDCTLLRKGNMNFSVVGLSFLYREGISLRERISPSGNAEIPRLGY
jgi:hypothetical protein